LSARALVIPPHDDAVLVGAAGSDAVSVLSRTSSTGLLDQRLRPEAACLSEDGTGGTCADGAGLDRVTDLALAPDGEFVYAASLNSGAVASLRWDRTAATLAQLPGTSGCLSWTGAGGECALGARINGAAAVAVAPDGRHVYTGAVYDDANSVFARQLAPSCADAGEPVLSGSPVTVELGCADPNGDPLTREIVRWPRHGSLSGFDPRAGTVTYRPEAGFAGPDSIAFRATDGRNASSVASLALTVSAPAPETAGPAPSLESPAGLPGSLPAPVAPAPTRPEPGAGLTVRARTARLLGARVHLRVGCPAGPPCVGVLELRLARPARGRRGGARGEVALGSRSFRLASGARAVLAVRLPTARRRELRERGRLGVTVRVVGYGAGNTTVSRSPVWLIGS